MDYHILSPESYSHAERWFLKHILQEKYLGHFGNNSQITTDSTLDLY